MSVPIYPNYYLELEGKIYKGKEARERGEKLQREMKKSWKPCCLLSKKVGCYEFHYDMRVGGNFEVSQCQSCKRVKMKRISK